MPAIVTDLDLEPVRTFMDQRHLRLHGRRFLVTMGTLGDRVGRRRVLLAGALAFGIASALAAFFSTAQQLIALARPARDIAGATIASTLPLIVNLFKDEGERNRAIGILARPLRWVA